jgi:nicotinamide mononucleotide adenylyltransferase
MSFNYTEPTVQMLGRFQPWHEGHTALFTKAHEKTGQVIIMIRDMPHSNKNPFTHGQVVATIINSLQQAGFEMGDDYVVSKVPNIVDISYGRDVGYSITQHHLDEETENISATKIRQQMRENNGSST